MFIGNFLDYREPQSGPLDFRRDIRFEGALENMLRKASPVVTNGKAYPPQSVRVIRSYSYVGIRCSFLGILRVLQQVVDHLPQLLRVAQDPRTFRIQFRRDGHLDR